MIQTPLIFLFKKKKKVSPKKKKNILFQSETINIQTNNKQKNALKHEKMITKKSSEILNNSKFSLRLSKPTYSIKLQKRIKKTIKDTPISEPIILESKIEEKETTLQPKSILSYNIFSDNNVDNATKQAIKAAMFGLRCH